MLIEGAVHCALVSGVSDSFIKSAAPCAFVSVASGVLIEGATTCIIYLSSWCSDILYIVTEVLCRCFV